MRSRRRPNSNLCPLCGAAITLLASSLELLSAACAVHPAFGEAEVIEMGAHVRPAFADNLPRVVRHGNRFFVNGLYRHGFLAAPALAQVLAEALMTDSDPKEITDEDRMQRRSA